MQFECIGVGNEDRLMSKQLTSELTINLTSRIIDCSFKSVYRLLGLINFMGRFCNSF